MNIPENLSRLVARARVLLMLAALTAILAGCAGTSQLPVTLTSVAKSEPNTTPSPSSQGAPKPSRTETPFAGHTVEGTATPAPTGQGVPALSPAATPSAVPGVEETTTLAPTPASLAGIDCEALRKGGVTSSVEASDDTWNQFRGAYPFHIQTVALTEPLRDQSRVLIVSEPPPHLDEAYFTKFTNSACGELFIQTNRIGFDGWARDAVIALPPLEEPVLAELLSRLYLDTYGTSYKATVVGLPVAPPSIGGSQIDLAASVSDLRRWTDGEAQFVSLDGGASKSLAVILNGNESGVFLSKEPGVVLWSIPRDEDLSGFGVEGRQFFMDSDLILGAVGSYDQVVIVARERVEPLLRLPPLRMETVLLLAAEGNNQVAQSYERNHFFAGKLEDKQDWAPIYLSNSLIDTEFGSLLNITDQMLKSWSMNGDVEYINFAYPEPSHWPPFSSSLRSVLKERGSILFNWNTDGAGYSTPVEPYEYVALYRTGALPITYMAGDENDEIGTISVRGHEQVAYDYFAGLNNPDLARVVQYTALFQVFKAFGVTTASFAPPNQSTQEADKELERQALILLERLVGLSPIEREKEVIRYLQHVIEAMIADYEQQKGTVIPVSEKERLKDPENISEVYPNSLSDDISELVEFLESGKSNWPDEAFPVLARMIAVPREYVPVDGQSVSDVEAWASDAYDLMQDFETHRMLHTFHRIEDVKEHYTAAFEEDSGGWIKTPSIVLSRDMTAESTGGHNIGASVTRLTPSSSIPQGEVRLENDILRYNPLDIDRIHALSRVLAVEKNSSPNQLNAALRASINEPLKRPQPLFQPPNRAERGLIIQQGAPSPIRIAPWWRVRRSSLAETAEIEAALTLGGSAIIITRGSTGYSISGPDESITTEAHTLTSMREVINRTLRDLPETDEVHFLFKGMSPEEARSFFITMDLRQRGIVNAIPDGKSVRSNVALLGQRFDWSKPEFGEVTIREFPGQVSEFAMNVTVPAIAVREPSLLMRIALYGQGRLPQGIREAIQSIVRKVLSSSETRNANQVIRDLERELKQIKQKYPNMKMELHYQYRGEADDPDGIIIARFVQPETQKGSRANSHS